MKHRIAVAVQKPILCQTHLDVITDDRFNGTRSVWDVGKKAQNAYNSQKKSKIYVFACVCSFVLLHKRFLTMCRHQVTDLALLCTKAKLIVRVDIFYLQHIISYRKDFIKRRTRK